MVMTDGTNKYHLASGKATMNEQIERRYASLPRIDAIVAVPGLGLHWPVPDFPEMAIKFGRSAIEGRVDLVMAVAPKSQSRPVF